MSILNKKQKLEYIISEVQKIGISVYELAKATEISQAGLGRLLKNQVKNPHETTLNTLIKYLESKKIVINNFENLVNDPMDEYLTLNKPTTELEKALMENVQILTNNIKLLVENQKLKNILEKNNIKY